MAGNSLDLIVLEIQNPLHSVHCYFEYYAIRTALYSLYCRPTV